MLLKKSLHLKCLSAVILGWLTDVDGPHRSSLRIQSQYAIDATPSSVEPIHPEAANFMESSAKLCRMYLTYPYKTFV